MNDAHGFNTFAFLQKKKKAETLRNSGVLAAAGANCSCFEAGSSGEPPGRNAYFFYMLMKSFKKDNKKQFSTLKRSPRAK